MLLMLYSLRDPLMLTPKNVRNFTLSHSLIRGGKSYQQGLLHLFYTETTTSYKEGLSTYKKTGIQSNEALLMRLFYLAKEG